jgi:hypothetical protein
MWRQLHNLCSSTNIVKVIKSKTNKLDVAGGMHGEEEKCAHVLGIDEKIVSKCILKTQKGRRWTSCI